MNIKEIKELAEKFTPDQLENCITQAIENEGKSDCYMGDDVMEVVNTLAKAETVRQLMEEGMSEVEAIRELAKRIRKVQGVE